MVLDENSVVRWHSEGLVPDPEQKLEEDQYTVITAVKWTLENL